MREIVESKITLRYFGLHWKDSVVIYHDREDCRKSFGVI